LTRREFFEVFTEFLNITYLKLILQNVNSLKYALKSVFNWWLSLQPPSHAGSSLVDFSTLKMEIIRSSETSVYARFTRHHMPEDGIFHAVYDFLTKKQRWTLVSMHNMTVYDTESIWKRGWNITGRQNV
jgi:hypothetical protein